MLARVSPQAIGAFGLLIVYINLVATFFFLGGNAVVIRFLPQLEPARRRAFLLTYSLVVLAALAPWIALSLFWPHGLRFLFGEIGGARFQQLLLWLAPIPIALSLATASLKGLLRIEWAQALNRAVTVASFLAYACLYVFALPLLRGHYAELMWGIYLTLAGLVAICAFVLLLRLMPPAPGPAPEPSPTPAQWPAGAEARSRPLLFLPPGFWGYTFGLQGNSAITFVATQLDVLFVLHWAGLRVLGLYVALMTLVAMAPVVLNLVLDSLLPSLTNALARPSDLAAASLGGGPIADLLDTFSRLLFPGALALAAALALFAAPLARLFGPQYLGIIPLLRVAAPLAALQCGGNLFGTIFSATGQPQRPIWAHLGRILLFVAVFPSLWRRWGLAGAVAAWIAAELTYQGILAWQLWARPPARAAFFHRGGAGRRGYLTLLACLPLILAAARLSASWPQLATAGLWLALVAGYFPVAGYSPGELLLLLRLLLPGELSPLRRQAGRPSSISAPADP